MFRARITQREVNRISNQYRPTPTKMRALGLYLWQQVKQRFSTQGASGGAPWMKKRVGEWGYNDGRAILTGVSGELLDSFAGFGEGNRATVNSISPYAHVHQLGTIGKGGTLPTIKPKNAKALFIPITDRAINSERLQGPDAALLRVGRFGGMRMNESPIRAAVRTTGYKPGKSLGTVVYSPLIKGRLKDGKLEKWNPITRQYEAGVPDFIFLKKVDIPRRQMLPGSNQEQLNQRRFIVGMFGPDRDTETDETSN